MKIASHLIVLSLLVLIQFLPVSANDAVKSNKDAESAALEKDRLEGQKRDLKRIKLVDSVGWEKTKGIIRPDESMDQLTKERANRKASNLLNFCSEDRFQKLAEVDSLKEMTQEERDFCKDRLKLVNPLIP